MPQNGKEFWECTGQADEENCNPKQLLLSMPRYLYFRPWTAKSDEINGHVWLVVNLKERQVKSI